MAIAAVRLCLVGIDRAGRSLRRSRRRLVAAPAVIRSRDVLPGLAPLPFARVVVPGSQGYTTPGTYTFVVPEYNTLVVDVKGAGGGGGSPPSIYWPEYEQGQTHYGFAGSAGGQSRFASSTNLIGNPGGGGSGGDTTWTGSGTYTWTNGTAGAAGTASGGDTNTTGGGAAGGTTLSANMPDYSGTVTTGPGGAGGRAQKSWAYGAAGAPAPGSSITVTVGAGTSTYTVGNAGSVTISWS